MATTTLYVTQDGADFYIYKTPEMDKLHNTWSHIGTRVTDLITAEAARAAFEAQARFAGYEVEWPHPFRSQGVAS